MAGTLGTISARITLDVRQAVASYAALRAQNQKTVYALRGTGDSFVQSGKTMALAGGAMVYAFGKVVNAAADFERKMDYFGAVTDTNSKQMQTLSKYTLQLAQDTIYSAGEIADGFIELGKSGINAKQIMHGVGDAMASLGAAGDIPLIQSGQILTSTMAQFGLKAKNAAHIANLLAGAANASIADITDIGYSLKYVGGIANTAGLKLDDVTTAISILAQAGIKGSTAGTTLRQMIVSLPGVTEAAEVQLEKLGIIAKDGSNKFYDLQGNLKPLSQVFQILQTHMKGLTAVQKTSALRTIFQTRALSSASVLMRAGADGFKKMYGEMSKVKAADVAHKRLDNLSGDIEILRGNIETFMVQAGTPFQDQMRKWVQLLTKLVQKFGELDPQTQKNIIQFIGMAGAALVVMGAFNIVIGTIFRFAASMLKMAAGVKFAWSWIKNMWTWVRLLASIFGDTLLVALEAAAAAVGVTVGAFVAIVAAILAVIAILVILYFKWGAFHDLVNAIVGAIGKAVKAIISFAKDLVTHPGKAVDKLKGLFGKLIGFFKGLGSKIWNGLKSGLSSVGQFVSKVGKFFKDLPGKVLKIVTDFVAKVREKLTFRNVGYAIGFLIGRIIGLFLKLGIKVVSAVISMGGKVIGFFKNLGPKIANFVSNMVNKAVNLWQRLKAKMLALTIAAINGTINFFKKLPGRVANFVTNMVAKSIALFQKIRTEGPKIISELVNNVINWFKALPGRVANFVTNMVNSARNKLVQMKNNFVSMAKSMYNGLIDGIKGLPGAVNDITDKIIQAIKDKITSAFNAVKDFAGGMWSGFKDGLGIHSPSHIERAMWQITGVVDAETKKLAKKTLEVQRLSKKMAATSFQVGDPGAPSGSKGYARLVSMHAANQNRVRSLSEATGNAALRDARRTDRKAGRDHKRVELKITNWHEGHGFIRGIAQDAIDDDHDYSDTLDRMG